MTKLQRTLSVLLIGILMIGIIPQVSFADQSTVRTYSKAKDGNTNLSASFKVREFACQDGSDTILIDSELVTVLQTIRNHYGKPVIINSAYRTLAHNRKVGSGDGSQHVKGTAADIHISGVAPADIAAYAESIGVRGIGKYGTHVHVDTRNTKYYWDSTSGREKAVSTFGGAAAAASKVTGVKISVSGQNVTVSWNTANNAAKYNVYLVQEPWAWKDIKYKTETTTTKHTFKDVKPGRYCAFVISRPNTDFVQSDWVEAIVEKPKHTHSYTTKYETAHPHKEYKICSCGDKQYTGKTKKVDSCEICNPKPKHEHEFTLKYETAHPHKEYKICDCGEKQYTGKTKKVDSCEECYPPEDDDPMQNPIEEQHTHRFSIKYETAHPHKEYRECITCGEKEYTGNTRKATSCEICYPPTEKQKREIKLQIGAPNMTVDGANQEIDPGRGTVPIIRNQRTMLPIRAVVESFGAYIVWDETEESVTIYAPDTTMKFWIGSTTAVVDDEEYELEVAPTVINSRTYMPIYFIASNMGLMVGWNEANETVTIEGMITR